MECLSWKKSNYIVKLAAILSWEMNESVQFRRYSDSMITPYGFLCLFAHEYGMNWNFCQKLIQSKIRFMSFFYIKHSRRLLTKERVGYLCLGHLKKSNDFETIYCSVGMGGVEIITSTLSTMTRRYCHNVISHSRHVNDVDNMTQLLI